MKQRKNVKLRFISLFLVVMMVLSVFPMGVFATETEATTTQTTQNAAEEQNNGDPAVLPNAEVKNLGYVTVEQGDEASSNCFGSSYWNYDLIHGTGLSSASDPFDLQIAMEFVAKDTAEEAKANYYGEYTTDFFITMTGMTNGSFVGNGCYLAGYYPSYGGWVTIPLDGFTVEAGKVYPVITSAGFDFSYIDICSSVQDFVCGIYLSDEVLAANPNLEVKLALGLSVDYDAAIAADYVTVGSYTYDVRDMTSVVAAVDGVKYDDLAEAFANAGEKATVTLLRNVKLTDPLTIPAGKTVTLDLNGKTISQEKAQTNAYAMIANEGDLTIKDSVGTGKISYADTTEYDKDNGFASNTIRNDGVLTVEGGTIENVSSDNVADYGYPHAIDVYPGSVTNIIGGTVKSNNYDAIRMFCSSATAATVMNISGGTIYNRVTFQHPSKNIAAKGELNITGGNFMSTMGKVNVRLLAYGTDYSQMKATISGGTFDVGVGISNYIGTDITWKPIIGGTFGVESAKEYLAEGYSLVKNANDTYTVAYAVKTENGTVESIVNAIVGETATDEAKKPVREVVETIVEELVTNGAMSGGYAPTNVPEGAELVVTLANIVLDESKEAPTKIVFDVTPMKGDEEVEPEQAITFRLPIPSSVNKSHVKVFHENEDLGLFAVKTENGAKYVEVSSKTFSAYTIDTDVECVAQIGDTYYATLAEAIANADGETVTLLADITLTEGVVIEAGKEVTLDLNGKTVSMSVAATTTSALITNNGTLTITDNSEEASGKLTYASSTVSTSYSTSTIINNGTLTVTRGTMENTSSGKASYVIDNYNTLTVNGGVLTGNGIIVIRQAQFGTYDNTVTINGGVIGTSDSYEGLRLHVFSDAKKTTTVINGGTLNGSAAVYTYFVKAEDSANTPNSANTSITINDGIFNGMVYLFNVCSVDDAFEVAITGGTFNGEVYVVVWGDDSYVEYTYLPVITGGTFTTDVFYCCADGFVIVENSDGTYDVAVDPESYGKVAKIDNTYYETLDDALLAAQSGGKTVKLIADVENAGNVIVGEGVTLDLNGYTLTATYVASFGTVTDSSKMAGKLVVAKTRILLNNDNAAMPIWDDGGYRFAVMDMQVKREDDGTDASMFSISFRPTVGDTDLNKLYFKDGMADNGLTVEIHMEWTNGDVAKDENIYIPESVLQEIYAGDLAITYTVTGIAETVSNLKVSIVVISDIGVQASQIVIP